MHARAKWAFVREPRFDVERDREAGADQYLQGGHPVGVVVTGNFFHRAVDGLVRQEGDGLHEIANHDKVAPRSRVEGHDVAVVRALRNQLTKA